MKWTDQTDRKTAPPKLSDKTIVKSPSFWWVVPVALAMAIIVVASCFVNA